MPTTADVLLIEGNDEDAAIALEALRTALPTCIPLRLQTGAEGQKYLFSNNSLTSKGENIKLIVTHINRIESSSFDFLAALKSSFYTQSLPVFSMLDDPGCRALFSEVLKADVTLCLVKSKGFGEKLKKEASYYWLLFE